MKMYYFTDPMCSWCYGFSPVMKKFKENYPEVDLQIISGGFSPGSKQVVDAEYKKFLEFHWNNVSLRSGQPFDHSMKFVSDTFVYDTEPSSRALAVINKLAPEQSFEFLSLMQKSFYVEGQDLTKGNVLAELAEKIGVDKEVFLENFNSDELKLKTKQGFEFSRKLGVRGFPTLLTLENGIPEILSHGFQPFESLKVIIDENLKNKTVSETCKNDVTNDCSNNQVVSEGCKDEGIVDCTSNKTVSEACKDEPINDCSNNEKVSEMSKNPSCEGDLCEI